MRKNPVLKIIIDNMGKNPTNEQMDDILTLLWRYYPIADYTLEEAQEKLRLNNKCKLLHGHYAFVGINPCIEDNLTTMKELYDYFRDRHGYKKDVMWCIEGHTENGYRPHIHALIKINKNSRKGHIINRLQKNLQLSNANSIDVKISSDPLLNYQRQRYIIGDKQDSKMDNVTADQQERDLYNIPNYIL